MHKNIIQKESMENELLNSSKALFKQSNRINHLLSLDTEHETSARLIDKYYRIFSKSLDRHVESKLRSQLSILLANFVELVRAGEDGFIRTPTGSKNLPQTRYFNGLTRNVYVKNILHNPAASGLIEMHKGFCSKNGNKETQIRPINQLKMDVLDILSSAKISRGTKESVVVREVIKGKYNPISREHEKRYIYIDYKDSTSLSF